MLILQNMMISAGFEECAFCCTCLFVEEPIAGVRPYRSHHLQAGVLVCSQGTNRSGVARAGKSLSGR
jgi:hypothetical protein